MQFLVDALVVQWIEHCTPNAAIEVRFLSRARAVSLVAEHPVCIREMRVRFPHGPQFKISRKYRLGAFLFPKFPLEYVL